MDSSACFWLLTTREHKIRYASPSIAYHMGLSGVKALVLGDVFQDTTLDWRSSTVPLLHMSWRLAFSSMETAYVTAVNGGGILLFLAHSQIGPSNKDNYTSSRPLHYDLKFPTEPYSKSMAIFLSSNETLLSAFPPDSISQWLQKDVAMLLDLPHFFSRIVTPGHSLRVQKEIQKLQIPLKDKIGPELLPSCQGPAIQISYLVGDAEIPVSSLVIKYHKYLFMITEPIQPYVLIFNKLLSTQTLNNPPSSHLLLNSNASTSVMHIPAATHNFPNHAVVDQYRKASPLSRSFSNLDFRTSGHIRCYSEENPMKRTRVQPEQRTPNEHFNPFGIFRAPSPLQMPKPVVNDVSKTGRLPPFRYGFPNRSDSDLLPVKTTASEIKYIHSSRLNEKHPTSILNTDKKAWDLRKCSSCGSHESVEWVTGVNGVTTYTAINKHLQQLRRQANKKVYPFAEMHPVWGSRFSRMAKRSYRTQDVQLTNGSLCNACGLRYARVVAKQRTDPANVHDSVDVSTSSTVSPSIPLDDEAESLNKQSHSLVSASDATIAKLDESL